MNHEHNDVFPSRPDILVSILCLSFNHEQYLRCALDSMIMQETNFKYEILVHDDASSDNSQGIISEYEKMYPDIVRSLKRTENVYSKGDLTSIWSYFFEQANGTFYAFCEGDDYWCSKHKLQKQISALIDSENIDLSFHSTKRLDAKTGKFCGFYGDYNIDSAIGGGVIPFPTLCELFISTTIHISSVVVRKSVFSSFYKFFAQHPWLDVGDYFIKLMGISGGAVYFKDGMSVYRELVTGSWSHNRENDIPLQMLHCIKMLSVSKDIMALYNGKYSVLGYRHLQKYTLELHTLLRSSQDDICVKSFYFGLRMKLGYELEKIMPNKILYYGAGTIFKSITNHQDINTVIEKGVVMVLNNGLVISSFPIENYPFKRDDVIIITPISRCRSIYEQMISSIAPDCNYILLDDLLTIDFINDTIFSSVKNYLHVRHNIENVSILSMC